MAEDLPSFSRVTAPGVTPERWLVLLHGILGTGNNWRGFAQKLVKARPAWGALLVDLRAHGGSRHLSPPDTLEAAARDVARLVATLDAPLGGILGHSFGGKVAVAALAQLGTIPKLFVVDSLPAARPDRRGSDETAGVLRVLARIPERFASQAELVAWLTGEGLSEPIAKWLAMSVDREDGGVRYGLDVRRIEALMTDYYERDLWPLLDPPPPGTEVHLVIGGRSPVYAAEDREHAVALATRHPEAISLYVLERAGHWVHVDDPAGLLAIVEAAL